MKAAFLEEFGKPLEIRDVEQPLVAEDEVLVRVEACDLSRGTFELIMGREDVRPPSLPIIPGSGASGIVERTGRRVKKVQPGDPVIVHGMIHCGQCSFCLRKRDNICPHAQYLGRTVNGVLAEFVKIPEANVIPISPDISFPEAAFISSSLAVSFHAIEVAEIEPEHFVTIYGCGSLGLAALVLILQKSSHIIVIDMDEKKLKLAKELGAWKAININEEKPSSSVLNLTGMEGSDRVLVMTGSAQANQEALLSVKRGGKIVLVGHTAEPFLVKPIQFIRQEITLTGIRHAPYHLVANLISIVTQQRISLNKLISYVLDPLSSVNKGIEILSRENPIKVIICPWQKSC